VDIPRLYTSACSYAVQPVRLNPILMSILLHHFKELTECIKEVERIEGKVNNNSSKKRQFTSNSSISINTQILTKEVKEKEEEKITATLDCFFMKKDET
jgi:hypothetical protein